MATEGKPAVGLDKDIKTNPKPSENKGTQVKPEPGKIQEAAKGVKFPSSK
jgi:hypothetical protein